MRTAEESNVGDALDLDTLGSVLRDHPVRLAIVFGSAATGATHPDSDVDVAVEFDAVDPTDREYNDVFLGLSADLSTAFATDEIDLLDVRSLSPSVATSVFEDGVLVHGDREHAVRLRNRVTADGERRSPRDRIDASLAKMEAHLSDDDSGVPAAGESENG